MEMEMSINMKMSCFFNAVLLYHVVQTSFSSYAHNMK